MLLATDAAVAGLDLLTNYGPIGVIAVVLIIFAKSAHQRERDRADTAAAEVQRLHEMIIEKIIPALTSATTAAQESADLLAAMQRERELDRFRKRGDE